MSTDKIEEYIEDHLPDQELVFDEDEFSEIIYSNLDKTNGSEKTTKK